LIVTLLRYQPLAPSAPLITGVIEGPASPAAPGAISRLPTTSASTTNRRRVGVTCTASPRPTVAARVKPVKRR
jgi:hypothetical protein